MYQRIARSVPVLILLGCVGQPNSGAVGSVGSESQALCGGDTGDLPQQASFTCELTVGPQLSPSIAAPSIDRDRMLMSHPGMRQKMLPLAFGDNDTLLMGGRYLFDTREQADDYADFVLHRYVLDGVEFVNRDYFLNHDCRAWSTIGAHDFADFRTHQVVMRTEHWQLPANAHVELLLRDRWPQVRAAAEARGLTSVWLLYNEDDGKVGLVYYADRVVPNDPTTPDFASLGALSGAAPLGAIFADQLTWTEDFDRTQWVFNIWQPFILGDKGAPSLFPYSPPLPALSCGDGLCTPSHGETGHSCPVDCPVHCGDARCQPHEGENVTNCPSDCRVPSSPIQ